MQGRFDRFDASVSPQLILIDPRTVAAEFDSSWWNAPGIASHVDADGMRVVDLGEGRLRHDAPDGSSAITGTTRYGQPVVRTHSGERDSWHIDADRLAGMLKEAVANEAQMPPACHMIPLPNGGKIASVQFPPGRGQAQLTVLGLKPGRNVRVYSDGPLSRQHQANLALAFQGVPSSAWTPCQEIFVVGELGGSGSHRMAGLTQYDSGRLFFARERLETLEDAQNTVWHEVGHLVDYAAGGGKHVSDTIEGGQLFGHGALRAKDGHVDLEHSDFVSQYASSSAWEDFAESNRVALTLRAAYAKARPQEDLFTQPTATVQGLIAASHVSPSIEQKLMNVVETYSSLVGAR